MGGLLPCLAAMLALAEGARAKAQTEKCGKSWLVGVMKSYKPPVPHAHDSNKDVMYTVCPSGVCREAHWVLQMKPKKGSGSVQRGP